MLKKVIHFLEKHNIRGKQQSYLALLFLLIATIPLTATLLGNQQIFRSRANSIYGVVPGIFVSNSLKTEPITTIYSPSLDLCLYAPDQELLDQAEGMKDKIADDADNNPLLSLSNNLIDSTNKAKAESLFVETADGKVPMNRAIVQAGTNGEYNFLPHNAPQHATTSAAISPNFAKNFLSDLKEQLTGLFTPTVNAQTQSLCKKFIARRTEACRKAPINSKTLTEQQCVDKGQNPFAESGELSCEQIDAKVQSSPNPSQALKAVNAFITSLDTDNTLVMPKTPEVDGLVKATSGTVGIPPNDDNDEPYRRAVEAASGCTASNCNLSRVVMAVASVPCNTSACYNDAAQFITGQDDQARANALAQSVISVASSPLTNGSAPAPVPQPAAPTPYVLPTIAPQAPGAPPVAAASTDPKTAAMQIFQKCVLTPNQIPSCTIQFYKDIGWNGVGTPPINPRKATADQLTQMGLGPVDNYSDYFTLDEWGKVQDGISAVKRSGETAAKATAENEFKGCLDRSRSQEGGPLGSPSTPQGCAGDYYYRLLNFGFRSETPFSLPSNVPLNPGETVDTNTAYNNATLAFNNRRPPQGTPGSPAAAPAAQTAAPQNPAPPTSPLTTQADPVDPNATFSKGLKEASADNLALSCLEFYDGITPKDKDLGDRYNTNVLTITGLNNDLIEKAKLLSPGFISAQVKKEGLDESGNRTSSSGFVSEYIQYKKADGSFTNEKYILGPNNKVVEIRRENYDINGAQQNAKVITKYGYQENGVTYDKNIFVAWNSGGSATINVGKDGKVDLMIAPPGQKIATVGASFTSVAEYEAAVKNSGDACKAGQNSLIPGAFAAFDSALDCSVALELMASADTLNEQPTPPPTADAQQAFYGTDVPDNQCGGEGQPACPEVVNPIDLQPACPEGTIRIDNSCIRNISDQLNQDDFENDCISNGGTVAAGSCLVSTDPVPVSAPKPEDCPEATAWDGLVCAPIGNEPPPAPVGDPDNGRVCDDGSSGYGDGTCPEDYGGTTCTDGQVNDGNGGCKDPEVEDEQPTPAKEEPTPDEEQPTPDPGQGDGNGDGGDGGNGDDGGGCEGEFCDSSLGSPLASLFGQVYAATVAPTKAVAKPTATTVKGKVLQSQTSKEGQICAQVITRACSIVNSAECKDFPTPCDVPTGWVRVNGERDINPTIDPNPAPASNGDNILPLNPTGATQTVTSNPRAFCDMPINTKVKKLVLENVEEGGTNRVEITDPLAFYDYGRGGVRWSVAPLKEGEESAQRTIKATYYVDDGSGRSDLTLAPKTLSTTITLNKVPEDGGIEGPQATIGNGSLSAVIGQTCTATQSFTIRAKNLKTNQITTIANNLKGNDLKLVNFNNLVKGDPYDFIIYGRNYVPKKVANLTVNDNTKVDFGQLIVGNVARTGGSKNNLDQADVETMVKEISKNKATRNNDLDLNCDGQVEVVDYSILISNLDQGPIFGDTLAGDNQPTYSLFETAEQAVSNLINAINPSRTTKSATDSAKPKIPPADNPLLQAPK